MYNLNYVFFEEFKRLDKLCGEIYHSQHGVTSYIEDMKSVSQPCISNWKSDLEKLIHLRHLRNHLAHTSGAFLENVCTQKDIDFVIEFYNRILSQKDPMALLYKMKKSVRPVSKQKQEYEIANMADTTMDGQSHTQSPNRSKSKWVVLGIVLIIIILVLFVEKYLLPLI